MWQKLLSALRAAAIVVASSMKTRDGWVGFAVGAIVAAVVSAVF